MDHLAEAPVALKTANKNRRGPWTPDRFAQELSELGLSREDYDFFRTEFLGNLLAHIVRWTPKTARVGSVLPKSAADRGSAEGWKFVRGRLTDSRILSHLRGDLLIGTGARWNESDAVHTTRFAAIDLDFKTSEKELRIRYDCVREALGQPSFVFQSSTSRGLHVYFHFGTDVDLWDVVRSRCGAHGAVTELLAGAGLPEVSGTTEVYPRGLYKATGPQQRLRAPFGSGCELLHAETLTPMTGKGRLADLHIARALFERGEIVLADPAHLCRAAAAYGKIVKVTNSVSRGARDSAPAGPSTAEKSHIWENGLKAPGSRHSMIAAFAFDMKFEGVPEEDAVRAITTWLDRNHNGFSRAHTANATRARLDAAAQVRRVYARAASSRNFGTLPPLTKAEARYVLDATACERVDPATGEVVGRLELARFLFELYRLAKQWLCSEAERRASALSQKEIGDADLALYEQLAPHLPVGREYFSIPIPKRRRRKMRGYGKDRPITLWRVLRSEGVLPIEVVASKAAKRAAQYHVRLDFLPRANALRFDSVEAAARRLLSSGERMAQFTEDERRSIASASRDRVSYSPREGENVVKRLLEKAPFSDRFTPVFSGDERTPLSDAPRLLGSRLSGNTGTTGTMAEHRRSQPLSLKAASH